MQHVSIGSFSVFSVEAFPALYRFPFLGPLFKTTPESVYWAWERGGPVSFLVGG